MTHSSRDHGADERVGHLPENPAGAGTARPAAPWVRLAVILLVALGVRLFTFCGHAGQPDEITIVEMVREVVDGTWPVYEDRIVEKVFPTRIGYVAVTSALVGLLGVSDVSYTLYSLAASLGTIVLVFLLGRRWIGEQGGLWAALLYAFLPLDIIYATKISSDPPLVFFSTLSVTLFFSADDGLTRRRRSLVAFLAGCVVGFAYLHKVTAGYFCVFFALVGVVDMVRRRRLMLRYVMLALGFFTVFAGEMAFQGHVNHAPLYRWHVYAEQARSHELIEGLHAEERLNGWKDDVKRLCWTFPLRSLVSLRQGFTYWFIFPAVGYCLLFRRRELWAPLLWWLFLALILNLSTVDGKRLPFYARQLYVITVPGTILLSAALMRLRRWPPLRVPAARKALLLALVAASVLSLSGFVCLVVFRGDLIPGMASFYASKHTVIPEAFVAWGLNIFFLYGMAAAMGVSCVFLAMSLVARNRERAGQTAWPGRVVSMTVLGLLAVTSVTFASASNRGVPRVEREAYEALCDLPPGTVYADWFTKKMLDFYSGLPGESRIVLFDEMDPAPREGAFLVYNTFRKNMREDLSDLTSQVQRTDKYLYSYQDVDRTLATGWTVVFQGKDDLVRIYRRGQQGARPFDPPPTP